ncbi:MAG TPA: creatininase family protein [Levilinea sp.]|nr:creatininase family protein [Levilinea sp.]
MTHGMFQDTMVNLNWPQIQEAVDENALVLLPLGVIEEHGPQLCLGTDIYTAHLHCLLIKQRLETAGLTAIIAPPFYWGICQSTGSFIGSFRVRKETMKALLFDILASLAEFGFKNVYGVNAHGDIEHSVALVETFREATEKLNLKAGYAFSESLLHHYGLTGAEPYICPVKPQAIQVSQAASPDVHAGDIETATIHHFYPDLVDVERARSLPPTRLGDDKIMSWLFGGQTAELSPNGYLGSPADFEGVDVVNNSNDIADRIADSILTHRKKMGDLKYTHGLFKIPPQCRDPHHTA